MAHRGPTLQLSDTDALVAQCLTPSPYASPKEDDVTEPLYIDVAMLDTVTGERRVYRDDFDWQDANETPEETRHTIAYMYEDGNYSCDCNRGKFFAESGGEGAPDLPCDGERIVVESIVERGTGKRIYSDLSDA